MAEQAHDERRRERRIPKTLFCQIFCEGKRYPAVVLDISPSGLFIRTAASPPAGTELEVKLRLAGGETWTLQTSIARKPRGGAAQGDILSSRGLGLQILEIPDGFSEFVASL
jgi:hypothetical protein